MAKNLIYKDGRYLPVVCTHPAAPDSGDPIRYGYRCGVAVTDEGDGGNDSTKTTVDFGPGVYDLSVAAVNDSGDSALAVGEPLYYTDADTPVLSKKSSGYPFGYALEAIGSGETATINVMVIGWPMGTQPGAGTVGQTQLGDEAVGPDQLEGTLATGFIPLDINTLRIISTNAVQNTTEGGVPDGNTDPILARVNAATDIALRLTWAAASVVEVQFAPIPKPPDLDAASDLTVHLMLAKDANTDTSAVIGVKFFDGVGDTSVGGDTAALAAAALAEKTVTIAAAGIAAAPGFFNVALVPGAHANDAEYLYAAWIEYTRAAN